MGRQDHYTEDHMNPSSIAVIPAHAGYRAVYDMGDFYEVGDPVIAWRIESAEIRGQWNSNCFPLTVDGEAANCVGVQNPDLTITVFEDSTYKTIDELNREKFAK